MLSSCFNFPWFIQLCCSLLLQIILVASREVAQDFKTLTCFILTTIRPMSFHNYIFSQMHFLQNAKITRVSMWVSKFGSFPLTVSRKIYYICQFISNNCLCIDWWFHSFSFVRFITTMILAKSPWFLCHNCKM